MQEMEHIINNSSMDTELEVLRIMIDTDTNVVSRVRKVIDLGDILTIEEANPKMKEDLDEANLVYLNIGYDEIIIVDKYKRIKKLWSDYKKHIADEHKNPFRHLLS